MTREERNSARRALKKKPATDLSRVCIEALDLLDEIEDVVFSAHPHWHNENALTDCTCVWCRLRRLIERKLSGSV